MDNQFTPQEVFMLANFFLIGVAMIIGAIGLWIEYDRDNGGPHYRHMRRRQRERQKRHDARMAQRQREHDAEMRFIRTGVR